MTETQNKNIRVIFSHLIPMRLSTIEFFFVSSSQLFCFVSRKKNIIHFPTRHPNKEWKRKVKKLNVQHPNFYNRTGERVTFFRETLRNSSAFTSIRHSSHVLLRTGLFGSGMKFTRTRRWLDGKLEEEKERKRRETDLRAVYEAVSLD